MAYSALRTFINRAGVVYDALKTSVIFAEDMNKIKNNITYLNDFKMNKGSIGAFMIQGQGMLSAPADSSTYYVGAPGWGVSTNKLYSQIPIYFNQGYINRVGVRIVRGGTQGSSENSAIYLQVNNTDYLISNTVLLGNLATIDLDISYLGIFVDYGDIVNLKIVTPAWVTNPTNVNIQFQFIVNDEAEVE